MSDNLAVVQIINNYKQSSNEKHHYEVSAPSGTSNP